MAFCGILIVCSLTGALINVFSFQCIKSSSRLLFRVWDEDDDSGLD